MNSALLMLMCLVAFIFAYKYYGEYIARKLFRSDGKAKVPAEVLRDDVDYIPTNKEVLFGHHFASIAGTGPIVGPAIAVIWGWLPALLWIVFGSIFAGAVHDYAALIISTRKRGASIGDVSKSLINARVKKLFLFVIFFSLWIVVAIFGMVMAIIFKMYPESVFPVWIQIPIAVTVGYLAYRKKANITVLSIFAVLLMYISIVVGVHMPISMPSFFGLSPMAIWIILLFVYAYIASVLPVWSLLQPRDYVNSHQLVVGILLIVLGILFARPPMVAPLINLSPKGAPPIFPFLFITVACGAVSGFHSLVSSGTSSKQLKNENDAKIIGFGGMLTEGFLGVLVLIAVAAGIGIASKNSHGEILTGVKAWEYHYSSWSAMQGLTQKVTAFVNGSANMINVLGIPIRYAQGLVGVLIASFAGTTLDTATRIQRYIINEISDDYKIDFLKRRHPATMLAVLSAAILAFSNADGKGALVLWPLFGTSNQLLAGLTLLVVTMYLIKHKSKILPALIPMIMMIVTSLWAMSINLIEFYKTDQIYLLLLSLILISLEIWMVIEAIRIVLIQRKKKVII